MERILLAEDEPTIAAGVQDDLELEGYMVELATDGDTAEARALSAQFELILLDVMLPKKDGLSVCRKLRASGILTPIVMLTARSQETDKVLGLELGADDYITKPFSRRELMARVKAALRRGAMATAVKAKAVLFGNCRIDFARCQAWKNGNEIELTALEFKLLHLFLLNPGEMLPIDRFCREAWGENVAISDRVIYTHMNNLRKKIEDDPHHPRHVITIRGLGYRFDS
jgi:DNA-binding response OmpR family regulator